MPSSVYDYRHVELDRVGYGKRVLQAPGGNSSDIFGMKDSSNGEHSSASSDAGSTCMTPSCPSTPTPLNGSTNGLNGQQLLSLDSGSDCSTPSSASSSRRGSRQEDTKNRLFGPELESPRRRVVDRMKSNIFAEPNHQTRATPAKKASEFVVRRNPITGEVYEEPDHGRVNGNGKLNGNAAAATRSLPTTPVRVRQPPGGKSSGIF